MKVQILTLFLFAAVVSGYRRVCYHTNWSQYRNGIGKFYPENIDPSLCTHIIYAFAKLNGNKLTAFEWNDESTPWMKGMYERFTALKQQNPNLIQMLAVGGWNMGSAPFHSMVSSDNNIREFATTSVKFLRSHGFDGLDLDWEYPALRGSPAGDRDRFTKLVQTVQQEFQSEAKSTGNTKLLLSMAMAAGKDKIDVAYNVPEFSKSVDMINLMTYDFHGAFEPYTGHNSPLHVGATETGNVTTYNVEFASEYIASKGAPREKMNIGMPLYGRSFTLKNSADNGVYAPIRAAGQAGLYTGEAGYLAYYEICKMFGSGTKHYSADQDVPYLVKGDQWISYDDVDSLKKKVDFIKSQGFGGTMVWALDTDDFTGSCGQGKYPLLHAINDELNRNTPTSNQPVTNQPTTTAPVTQPPVTTASTTPAPITWRPQNPDTTTQPQWQQPSTTVQTPPPQPSQPLPTSQPPQPAQTSQPPQTPQPSQPPQTSQPSQTTSSQGVHHTLHPSSVFNCQGKTTGFYASPYDCSRYYICARGFTYEVDCTAGLLFNPKTLYCDNANNVICNPTSTMPPQTNQAATTQQLPTTKAPLQTQNPVTQQPSVQPVVTNAPVQTQQPQTQPPQTQAPVTQPPQTQAPVTQPSQTQAPVTQPPQTQAPVTQPPQTQAPVTQPPQTQAPVTQAPSNNGQQDFCAGKAQGHYSDPDCTKFHECASGLHFIQYCSAGTVYNEMSQNCDYPANVPRCSNSG